MKIPLLNLDALPRALYDWLMNSDFDHVHLFVDADSCPRQVRAIILKAVEKRGVSALFAADRPLKDVLEVEQRNIRDPFLIRMSVVEKGDDSADDYLVSIASAGSLAVTRDVPLAARLVEKGLTVLDDRGGLFTSNNVKERLSLRNAMMEFREMMIFDQKNKPVTAREIQKFANALDRELTKLGK